MKSPQHMSSPKKADQRKRRRESKTLTKKGLKERGKQLNIGGGTNEHQPASSAVMTFPMVGPFGLCSVPCIVNAQGAAMSMGPTMAGPVMGPEVGSSLLSMSLFSNGFGQGQIRPLPATLAPLATFSPLEAQGVPAPAIVRQLSYYRRFRHHLLRRKLLP